MDRNQPPLNKDQRKAIERHVAGAAVVHKSPFHGLMTFQSEGQFDKAFIQKYVSPLYMNLLRICDHENELREATIQLRDEITVDIAKTLLGDFNWRTRSTGAFFAAVFNLGELQENIGRLLLKSEVCYAGKTYALTLATFNNKHCVRFLNDYLDYYLHQTTLPFDQASVLGTLILLDELNGSNEALRHLEYLKRSTRPEQDIEQIRSSLVERPKADMAVLNSIRAALSWVL